MPDALPPKAPKPWTITHIDTSETCLRQYYEKYELGSIPYVETPQTKEGNRVHQQLYLRLVGKLSLPTNLEFAEKYCASFERSGMTIHAEMQAALSRDLKPVGYNDKNPPPWHRIKMDVVLLGETSAAIFDWKTGNDKYEKTFQLDMSALDIMAKFPNIEKVSVANVYLKTDRLGTPRHYTRAKDWGSIAADAYQRVDVLERARKAGRWPEMEGPLCGWCDVLACQFNRKGQ